MEEKLDRIIYLLEQLNSNIEDLKNDIFFQSNKNTLPEDIIDEIIDSANFKIDENGNVVNV